MAIVRRKPQTSQYVSLDDRGVLSVRVPQQCVNWPDDFRLRLSKFWLSPGRVFQRNKFLEEYVDNGMSDLVYKVDGIKVKVYYRFSPLASPKNGIVINATVLENVGTGIGIELVHPEFPFRTLQTFEFLHDVIIGGVPTTKRVERPK